MRMRELELGKGTINYAGETPEYFAAQDRRRWWVRLLFSGLLVIAGVTLLAGPLLGTADPVYNATVIGSATPGEAQLSYGSPAKQIAVILPVAEAWAVGSTIQISVAPNGAVTVGNYRQTVVLLGAGLVLLGLGIEIVGRRRNAAQTKGAPLTS